MSRVAEAAIIVHQVSKKFAEKTAVDRVSLVVGSGTGVALTGANGAGKSTLLKMVYGAVKPSSGLIRVGGIDVVRHPADGRGSLGIVPQEDCLDPDLSVRDNLRFHARYARMSRGEADERTALLLASLGLDGRGDDPVALLSGGLRRRLVLARALLTNPSILILDEPTRSLDQESRDLFFEFLLGLKGKGATLLLATHDQEEAELLCDRIALLEDGRIASVRTVCFERHPHLSVLAGGVS